MSRHSSNIFLEPIITEKSSTLSRLNKYTFKVAKGADKGSIKKAFEEIFPGRKVLAIQTAKIAGHKRRTKGGFKKPIDCKKAILTIKGDRIEYFPESA